MRHPLGSRARRVHTAAVLRNRFVQRLAEPGLSLAQVSGGIAEQRMIILVRA
jgi:hypothetical protein